MKMMIQIKMKSSSLVTFGYSFMVLEIDIV